MRKVVLFFLFLISSAISQAQIWHAAGKVAAAVPAVCGNAISGHILAGTSSGLFLSRDTGKSWVMIAAMQTTALAVLDGTDSILCGTPTGLFIGTEAGPWTSLSDASIMSVSPYGIAGTADGRLLKRATGWKQID